MEYVALWIVFSIVAGIIAGAKGRSGFGYFLLSLILSPLIGLILAAALPRIDQPQAAQADPMLYRRCPECAEPILREAHKCKHCGSAVEPMPLPPTLAQRIGRSIGRSFSGKALEN